eukprot:CAMPEP_0113534198 /NCGR_PEP_ID=MMETSP0015_2-20120614/5032_1 /TAXON_ID=2838 /ORGANISM="Odontella" /LENGTH=404 /DNA_ID=CAMNT_0000433345 /DNA_START=71 /DNA_END=1285 /DNA_ORIENTATION=- /assembly_acc=CAM_ASM_000160
MTPLSTRRNGGLACRLASCILLLLAGRCSAQWHDTHGAKKMVAAFTKEDTNKRKQSNEWRSQYKALYVNLEKALDVEQKSLYEQRGSKYYADGTTEIVGNENAGARPHDPRSAAGFGDATWAKIHGTEGGNLPVSSFETAALESSDATAETVDSGWTYAMGWGATQYDGVFDEALLSGLAGNKIIRRSCNGCVATHEEIYYKRKTSTPADMATILKQDWKSAGNTLGSDFDLYSTYQDALDGVNPWLFCDYDGGTGFPGNCGPTGSVEGQWNMFDPRGGQNEVAFAVEDTSVGDDVRGLNEVEVVLEAKLRSDPEKYLAEGGCYGLFKLDDRRACYRSCHYMKYKFDEGTAKTCRSLMAIGSGEGGKKLNALREFDGDGTEKGNKIKLSHMLGNDDGLPNTGVY